MEAAEQAHSMGPRRICAAGARAAGRRGAAQGSRSTFRRRIGNPRRRARRRIRPRKNIGQNRRAGVPCSTGSKIRSNLHRSRREGAQCRAEQQTERKRQHLSARRRVLPQTTKTESSLQTRLSRRRGESPQKKAIPAAVPQEQARIRASAMCLRKSGVHRLCPPRSGRHPVHQRAAAWHPAQVPREQRSARMLRALPSARCRSAERDHRQSPKWQEQMLPHRRGRPVSSGMAGTRHPYL